MYSLSDAIVSLWFLPVVLQIVLPLVIFVVGLGSMLFKSLTVKGDVAKPVAHTSSGGHA